MVSVCGCRMPKFLFISSPPPPPSLLLIAPISTSSPFLFFFYFISLFLVSLLIIPLLYLRFLYSLSSYIASRFSLPISLSLPITHFSCPYLSPFPFPSPCPYLSHFPLPISLPISLLLPFTHFLIHIAFLFFSCLNLYQFLTFLLPILPNLFLPSFLILP